MTMDCLRAQTCITSYMEDKLGKNELKEFLLHVENCPNCWEELEIYYTLLVGTKQLDEGEITTTNFSQELGEKIKTQLSQISHFERMSRRIYSGLGALGLFLVLWTVVKWTDFHIPILNPAPAVAWEQQKKFIEVYALPYMFQPAYHQPERIIAR